MINKIKLKYLIVAVIAMFSMLILPTSFVYADIKTEICDGVSATGGGCDTVGASSEVSDLVQTIIDLFSWVVGVVAVIMVIFGGFRYITAAGDSGKVGNAKNTILYALIGLVIVALAQVIVQFVITRV